MATTFPVSTYPLSSDTRFEDEHLVEVDVFDDGTMQSRQLSSSTFRVINCAFEPMPIQTAKTFEEYLRTNRGIEWDLSIEYGSPQTIYRGYIVSEIDVDPGEGNLYMVKFRFRGKVV